MNNWHDEYMAEFNRQRIVNEITQIRLEQAALRSRIYRPGLFERTMYNFANWMISTGKQLRKRYTRSTICLANRVDEVPAAHCRKSPTGSFAH